jgi:PilZ domain
MAEKMSWITALRHSVTGTDERRREERRYLKMPIEVRLASGETHAGFSRDLTRYGMGAVISTPLKVGQEVWVKFDYPNAADGTPREILCQATVRQCLGFRYGLEFRAPLDL